MRLGVRLSPLTEARWRRFRRNRIAFGALLVLVGLCVVSLCAPLLTRYSPHEVIDIKTLEPYAQIRLSLVPQLTAGRFNLMPDGTITRSEGCEAFFDAAAGLKLEQAFAISPDVTTAVDLRLRAAEAPACELPVMTLREPRQQVVLKFLKATARSTPPASVRISVVPDGQHQAGFTLDFPAPTGRTWKGLSTSEQSMLAELAAIDGGVMTNITWRGQAAEVKVSQQPPSWPFPPVNGHWMGLDAAGRDVWTRVLYGMRVSLCFGTLLAAWSMLMGLLIGAIQGYLGGWVDIVVQRFTEIWSALPFLYVMILIGAVLGRSFVLLLICYGIFNWIGLSYYMRGEFLRLRNRPFIDAARTQRLSSFRIIFRHILPNALTPMITLFPFILVGAIASLAALDFLGFGLPPGTPSWGELLQEGQQYRKAWWLIFYPSAALFVVMLAAILVGEGLRNAFDPKPTDRID